MKTWQIVLISVLAASVLTALGGFLIVKYGDTSEDVGKVKCEAAQVKTEIREVIKYVKVKADVEKETAKMSDPAIDADLDNLGIMRDDADR